MIKWAPDSKEWWLHQMETFSALLAFCAGNSPDTGEFRAQRPVMRSSDVFFDLRLNKRLSKQSWFWWFETPPRSVWRHCNGVILPLAFRTTGVCCCSPLTVVIWTLALVAKEVYKMKSSSPDSKIHGANIGPIWGRQDPGGSHVGPMNLAIWD